MPVAKIAPVEDDRGRKNYAVHALLTPDDGPEERKRFPNGGGFLGHFETYSLAERAALSQGLTVPNADVQKLQADLRKALVAQYKPPFPGATFDWFEDNSIAQTLMFYTDLVPYLHHFLAKLPWGQTITMLDAGCGSGSGADYIGRLHRSAFLGHRYEMTGVDLFDTYKRYAEVAFPHMNYIVGNVFDIATNAYDVVICSHVIEHFEDPTAFMRQLTSISRLFTLFYCPFEEQKLLEGGHLKSIQRDFVESFAPAFVEVRDSLAWRHPRDAESKCIVFAVPGRDWAELDVPPAFAWSPDEPPPRLRNRIG